MKIVNILLLLCAVAVVAGCSASRSQATTETFDAAPLKKGLNPEMVPAARIYKMNGDYSQLVPVTVVNGNVVSFPDPTDLKDAEPVALEGGFWLDRRGVGEATAFTRWTYPQYMALKAAPSLGEIKNAIVEGAAITEIVELPVTAAEAIANPAICNRYIADGLKGCKIIKR